MNDWIISTVLMSSRVEITKELPLTLKNEEKATKAVFPNLILILKNDAINAIKIQNAVMLGICRWRECS